MGQVTVKSNKYTVSPMYQWDRNQVLTIYGLSLDSAPEIHFTNTDMSRAIVKQASMDNAGVVTVEVPNSLLQKSYNITAYICDHDGDKFNTMYTVEIPVKARKKPADYVLENDEEVYSFNALENDISDLAHLIEAHNTIDDVLVQKIETLDKELRNDYATTDAELNDKYATLSSRVVEDLNTFSDDLGYLKTYITPQMYGAKGDGVTDDTEVLNEVLTTERRILFENGTFLVSDTLNITSDTVIEMKNATILSTATEEKKYIFNIHDKTNVKIIGDNSHLKMMKPETAQQACIGIFNSTNVCIRGLTLEDAGGDGIIVGGTNEKIASDIDIENCIIDNSRRNGVSLVGGIDGLSIQGCVIKNTSGTSPQLGIDIETWDPAYTNKNILVFNNRFENNKAGDLTIFEYSNGVKVYNNHFGYRVSAKINTAYNGVIEANPTDLSFYNNVFESTLYFYGVSYGSFNIQENIFDGGQLMIESPVTFTLEDTKNTQSKLVKGNTFNNSNAALMIGQNANMIICDNVVNNCKMFLSAWSFFKSVIKGNLINGYNTNGDSNRLIEFNGIIDSITVENNTVLSNANTTSATHMVYYKGGSAFNNVCRNNNFSNADFTTPIGYDARNNNIDYGNSIPTCDNFCSALPPADKKFAGMILSIVGQTSIYTYICTLVDGNYRWKELTFTT